MICVLEAAPYAVVHGLVTHACRIAMKRPRVTFVLVLPQAPHDMWSVDSRLHCGGPAHTVARTHQRTNARSVPAALLLAHGSIVGVLRE